MTFSSIFITNHKKKLEGSYLLCIVWRNIVDSDNVVVFNLSLHFTIALKAGVKSSFTGYPNVICKLIGGNSVKIIFCL